LVKYKNKFAKFPKKSVTFCGFDGTYIQQIVMENRDWIAEVRKRRLVGKEQIVMENRDWAQSSGRVGRVRRTRRSSFL